MKRSGTGRLLTPKQMVVLMTEAFCRDCGCLVCGEQKNLHAHHILPQTIIKREYLARGGVVTQSEPFDLTYAPISRFEFWREPDITASEIAADPDTVISLCQHHHEQIENGTTSDLWMVDALVPHAKQIINVGTKYSMLPQLERHYGRRVWKEIERAANH